MKKLPALLNTPAKAVMAVGLFILLGEFLIMVLFEDAYNALLKDTVLKGVSFEFIDPFLLTLLVSPALFLLIFKPMHKQQVELKDAHIKIRQAFQEWAAALDAVDDPIFMHDQQCRILRCNKAYQLLAGIPFKQIIGQPYYEIFPKNHAPLPCCLRAMEKAEEENEQEVLVVGEAIYRSRAFSIKDEQQVYLYSVHTLEDITERKQVATAMAESEMRLRTIIQSEPECVKTLDNNGVLLDMNPAGLAMIEADSLEQVRGTKIVNIVAPAYRAAFEALNASVFRGESGTLEFEIVGLKGMRRWLETHVVPLRNVEGTITSLLGITRDITEHKESEAAFRALVGTAAANIGAAFFHETVSSLSTWLGVECCIVGELVDENKVRALAMQLDGKAIEHYEYALTGTPCDSATHKGYCEYPEAVCRFFPADKDLSDMGAEAYVGMPIRDKSGKVVGILCAISRHKIVPPPMLKGVFEIIAARTGAEIERKHAEARLAEQIEELRGWHDVTLGREMRIIELKHEVDELLRQAGQPPRYPSAEPDDLQEK